MTWLTLFWGQSCRPYRNFQVMFLILTLNFAIPSLVYVFAPQAAIDQWRAVNAALGGAPYPFPEAQSRIWRYLGSSNVMTLALMCFLLQVNLRRYRPILGTLIFLKMGTATLMLAGFLAAPQFPGLLAVAVLDYVTSAAFAYFAGGAHRAIAEVPDEDLVPAPQPWGL